MDMRSRIVDLISEAGVGFKEKANTIYTTCPICQKDDKFSILKKNGACICYRGTCTFKKRLIQRMGRTPRSRHRH